jgi:hypothetical protein
VKRRGFDETAATGIVSNRWKGQNRNRRHGRADRWGQLLGSISEAAHARFRPLEHGAREQPERPDLRFYVRSLCTRARGTPRQVRPSRESLASRRPPAAAVAGALSGGLGPWVPKLGPRVDLLGFAGRSSLRIPRGSRSRSVSARRRRGNADNATVVARCFCAARCAG